MRDSEEIVQLTCHAKQPAGFIVQCEVLPSPCRSPTALTTGGIAPHDRSEEQIMPRRFSGLEAARAVERKRFLTDVLASRFEGCLVVAVIAEEGGFFFLGNKKQRSPQFEQPEIH